MRSAAGLFLAALRANLASGVRLGLFVKVSRLDFRVSGEQYAALVVVSLAFWALGGIAREGLPAALNPSAPAIALAQVALLLFVCLIAARLFGRPSLALAFAVLFTATDPLFEVAGVAVRLVFDLEFLAAWGGVANWLFLAWAFATLVRAQYLLTGWRRWNSIAANALFAAMLVIFTVVFPRPELWSPDPASQARARPPSIAQEELFHLQAGRLDSQLARIEPQRPGVEDLYFIGVAPYGLQDTFKQELASVQRLMDQRFDTAGRSLALVNHPATLGQLPIATVTNLRTAIERLAGTFDVEEDMLMLFLTTHGSDNHELAFELPPLQLQQLTPTALARMLNDSGIKWKIIVISACYSGGFVEPLSDENTLIVTASDATSASFGCEFQSNFTWFSKAFFDQALRRTYSFVGAFDLARSALAEQEKSAAIEPSRPQIFVGASIRAKLDSLGRRLEARDASRNSVPTRR